MTLQVVQDIYGITYDNSSAYIDYGNVYISLEEDTVLAP